MKKNAFGSLMLVALLGAGAAGCVVRGSGHVSAPVAMVEVYEEPPPPRVVTVSQRPGFIWIDGRWDHRGGRYVWMDGRYERQRANSSYQQGRWERRGRGHVWVEGRWGAGGGRGGRDMDRDGVRDHRDGDRDGDGVRNRNDSRPNRPGPTVRDHRR